MNSQKVCKAWNKLPNTNAAAALDKSSLTLNKSQPLYGQKSCDIYVVMPIYDTTTLELLHCFTIVKQFNKYTQLYSFSYILTKDQKYHKNFFLPSIPPKKTYFVPEFLPIVYKKWFNQMNRIILDSPYYGSP